MSIIIGDRVSEYTEQRPCKLCGEAVLVRPQNASDPTVLFFLCWTCWDAGGTHSVDITSPESYPTGGETIDLSPWLSAQEAPDS